MLFSSLIHSKLFDWLLWLPQGPIVSLALSDNRISVFTESFAEFPYFRFLAEDSLAIALKKSGSAALCYGPE